MVHSWTGDEDIPEISPARVLAEDLVLAGSRMPAAVVDQRASRFEIVDAYIPGWRKLSSPTGQILGDAPDEALRTAGVYLEELHGLLRTSLGGTYTPSFFVKIFKEPQDFRALASLVGAPNAESFYDPRTHDMVFWFGQYATPELFQRAFAHEFTHAYMDQVWNVTQPIWFAEGMAEYFSDLEWTGDQLVAGAVNRRAALILGLEKILPLKNFLRLTRDDFYGVEFQRYYAQAWAFVHFLYNRSPRAIEKLLQKETVEDLADADLAFQNYFERTIKA